eukprot:4252838-Pyramimonas_sp.AAC.1
MSFSDETELTSLTHSGSDPSGPSSSPDSPPTVGDSFRRFLGESSGTSQASLIERVARASWTWSASASSSQRVPGKPAKRRSNTA